MLNYCARLIPNYATLSEPIRRLMRKNTEWSWKNEQQTAFNKLKELLTEDTTMAYNHPYKYSEISPVGLGAIFMQNVVSHASKALTDTERRYGQTECDSYSSIITASKALLHLGQCNCTYQIAL